MSRPNDKLDLDALLASWPAPSRDEKAWEDRADAIVKAALDAPKQEGADVVLAKTLLEAPPLEAEPGEPQVPVASAGENKMSQDSEQGGAAKQDVPPASAVPSTVAPRSAERKKGSLKEIAARASQAGAASKPGTAIPTAPASRTGASSPASATATPLPVAAAPSGALEDSGIVDLNVVKAKATPEQKEAADKAKPGTEGILDDEKEKPAAAAGGKVVAMPAKTAAASKPEEKKKGSGGVIAGVAIAVLGIAAAFAITKVNKPAEPTATTESRPTPAQEGPQGPAKPAEQAQAASPDTPSPAAADGQPAEAAPSGGGEKVAAAPAGGSAGSAPAAGGSEPAAEPAKEAEGAPKEAAATPPVGGTPAAPGDLKGAMAAAVGADANKGAAPTAENAEPAAGSRNQSIPEQPSQGQVNAAIRGVMPSVKACVAGADDVSRATVTFGSNGSVKSVSVSGWAASHGATGCIKAALQGANVGPFAKSTFTTGFPIRP